MKYLFTGGGTGGHLYPALAVARELAANPDNELLYVGIRGRAEEQVLGGDRRDPRIPLVFATSASFPGLRSLRLFPFLMKLGLGCLQAAGHLLHFRPDLVFATGGYASAPSVFAAYGLRKLGLLKTRILIHEQNVQPGLMNRKAAGLADVVALTFPASVAHVPGRKIRLCGYPVRRDLLDRPGREQACQSFGLDPARPVLLVFGGSQGSRCINQTVYGLLPDLLAAGIQVIHGYGVARGVYDAGARHNEAIAQLREDPETAGHMDEAYRPFDYLHDIREGYAAADLVLARAGAGAIFELVTCQVPAILVPKMGLPADHQVANARIIEKTGAAKVVLERPRPVAGGFEEEVDQPQLLAMIRNLVTDSEALEKMSACCVPLSMAEALEDFVMLSEDLASQGVIEPDSSIAPEETDEMAQLEMASDEQLLAVARGAEIDEATRRYLTYRFGAALASDNWARRNRGIKLAGMLKDPTAIPLLMHIARDERRPGFLARLLGEKKFQNGFIRRNLATSLGQIAVASPEVITVLGEMLNDSYWEVRVEAMRALAHLQPGTHEPSLVGRVEAFLGQGNFEEIQAAIYYWSHLGQGNNWQELILPLLNHNNIRVRQAAVAALIEQVRKNVLPGTELEPVLREVLVTSTWFSPEFPLKTLLRNLTVAIEEQKSADKNPADETGGGS